MASSRLSSSSRSLLRPVSGFRSSVGFRPLLTSSLVPVRSFSSSPSTFTSSSSRSSSSSSSRFPFAWGALGVALGVTVVGGVALSDSKETKLPAPSSGADWNAVRAAIVDTLDVENYDDGSRGPVYVRLAWHAAGTFDKKSNTGGSDGATMRFAEESKHGANAGLAYARDALEPVKKKFPNISYADLWTLAGTVAIEEMGGPKMAWRPGRSDHAGPSSPVPDGRLPDAAQGQSHIRDIFYRMGFNDQEIVALLGAHALGRCHEDRSGFKGPWTRAPTTFSNEFFRVLLEEKWTENKTYTKAKQFQDKTGELMMLPADLALIADPEFKKWVDVYSKDEAKFFKDFSAAWTKLMELGCKNLASSPVTWKA